MAGGKPVFADDDATGFQNEGDGGLYEDRAEDEDDDGPDAYEIDGFIVDDVEEEDDGDNCGERQKKKKKKKREAERSYLLDEDDYELLQESNISVPRPNLNKKLKRLKKAQGDTKEESSVFSGEWQHSGSEKGWRTAEERLKYSLFGDDGQFEDMDEEDEQQEKQNVDIAEEDEMADFIVDEDQIDEHGASTRRKKQPRSMQQSGIPSSALQEAREIFGDVEDLLKIRKLEAVDIFGEAGERSLEDQFDPSVLSEKYMTGKDDLIRNIDIPERVQIYKESTGLSLLDEICIEVESEWIYNQLVSGAVPLYSKSADSTEGSDELKGHIAKYLELLHVQKLDVPFIAMYRKEEILSLLKDPDDPEAYLQADPIQKPKLKRHKVLWTIRDLDQTWLLLLKRKGTLQSNYTKRFKEETRRVDDDTKLNLNQQLFESITMSLKAANSESEVDDVDSKFSLHFPPDEVVLDEGMYKRPKRKSHYRICSKAGLWEVANKFGYSPEQFGLQISLEKMRMDELEDAKEAPEEMASNFTSMMFETPQAVLKGARHMAAVEISCEPSVRKHVRGIFMDNAVVSTRPTPDGNSAIDSFHQFSGVKWLRDKPLSRFEDAQWLLIQKAEEEKLLQVTIKLPEAVLDKLLSDSRDYYLSDGVSKSAQSWNEQRKQILEDAFQNILLPSMEKDAISWLTSRSKTWLLEEYGKLLWDKVSVAPYQRKENDINSNEEAVPRVLACCWGPGKPATTFVMLDSSGEVEDVLNAGCLNLRGQSVNDLQRKKNDQQRVQKFMMDHQPHAVVLGAANLSCTRLKDDIYEIIFKLVEDNPRDSPKISSLNIVYGDESLPRLYENSRVSVDQLPSQEGIVRRAVALGRYLQNPLAMVATLCGPGREILSWKLNPLEKFLTPDEKYGMVEQVMIDATNQVGLDINLASSHEWLFSNLQFISGLGPRKAASLQRSLVRDGAIFTRKDLLTSHGLGKKVFINAVGFLRVQRSGLSSSSSQFIDLLDDTRIHPESYSLAQELAKDVYCESMNNEVNDDDDDLLEMAIEHLRENPHLLTAVDVHEYAKQKNRQNKKESLDDIRLELMDGFQDWRKSHVEPNQDDEFNMITGETEETLAEGRIVQATVRRVQEDRAICNLDIGLTGILSKEDYTDDWRDLNDLTDKLHDGDILTCRIKSIQKNRYQVFLTCRESEMKSNRFQNNQIADPYFHEERSTLQPKQEIAHKGKELSKKLFKPRVIVHPQFKNITADEAFEFLRDKEAGESVIRPSLRGPSFLTLTLKVFDGVFANKDIVEGQKELKDITSLLQIGKTLKIGDDTFEDLDEVMDRYVDPLIAHLKTMLNYRKFRKGTKTDIDELLRIEKAKIPTKIVYCLGLSYDHPGTFILAYIRSVTPHHEYIGLYSKGFKFRKRMFGNVDSLVAYFQKHIDDPRSSGPTIQSAAAKVPIRSFGSGDDWGGSNNESMDGDKTFGLGARGGRGDSQNGGRGRGRGRGRGPGRGSYSHGRSDKQDFDNDSQKWGSNNEKGADWGGGPSGSTSGWGGGDGSVNTGSWSGVGGGSKGDGNCRGGGSGSAGGAIGNIGGWGGAGGGIKSDSNWGGGRIGGAGGLGGGGGQTESAGGWGGGRGGDRSGSAGGWGGGDASGNSGGWGGARGGSKNEGNWGGDGSGGAGGGGGGDQSGSSGGGNKSDGNWGGGGHGDAGGWGGGGGRGRGGGGGRGGQRGSTGDCEIGGGGSKADGKWGGCRSEDTKGWGKGGSGTTGVGDGGGGQSGSTGGWGGDRTGHGGSGKTGDWGGGGRDNTDGGGCGASGGCGGEGGGSGRAGTWGGGGNDGAGGGSANAGAWGGSGGGTGSAGAWGDAGGTSADGGCARAGGWGSGSNNRSTGGMGEGIGSGSTGGWGDDSSHKSAGGGDRGSGWGSGGDGGSTGGWKGGGHGNASGHWGGSHGASGGTRGDGTGRGSSAGGRYGRSGGTGGGRGGNSSRSTGGRCGGTGSGSTGGWGGGGGSTGGWKGGGKDNTGTGWGGGGGSTGGWKGAGQDNTGTGWGGSHGASGGSEGGGAGWGGGHGSSGGCGDIGGGGRSGGAGARGGSDSDSVGGWVGSGSGGSGSWGDGGSSNAGGSNASAVGWGGGSSSSTGGRGGGTGKGSTGGWADGGGGSEIADGGGGNAGGWGVRGTKKEGGGGGGGTGTGGTGSWGGGSENADGGGSENAGGWGVSGTKIEGGGGWGQGSDAGNSGWGSSKKSSETGKGGW